MEEPVSDVLAKVPLLAVLDPESRRLLAQRCRRRRLRAEHVLFEEGDDGSVLYIVLSGRVRIMRELAGEKASFLYVQGPGSTFGELSLLDGRPRSATAVAMDEDVELLTLNRDDFLTLIEERPQAARAVMVGLAGMVRRLTEQVEDLIAQTPEVRLARRLLQLAAEHGEKTPDGIRIDLHVTQTQLGQMIGVTRQKINDILAGWRERGVYSTDAAKRHLLQRPEALKHLIETGTLPRGLKPRGTETPAPTACR